MRKRLRQSRETRADSSYVRRYEQKFECGVASAAFLREEIGRHLPLYEYWPGFPQTWITTVYYDTRDQAFYRQAERSYDNSTKIRVKEYSYRNAEGAYICLPYCFIELKERREGAVLKRRVPLPKVELERFLRGEDVWQAICDLNGHARDRRRSLQEAYRELREQVALQPLVAASVISYCRTVYQESEERLRITFDDRIGVYNAPSDIYIYRDRDSLHPGHLGPPVRRYDKVILEIKCPACQYPVWLEDLLENHFAKQLSKFTTSVRFLTSRNSERMGRPETPDRDPGGESDPDDTAMVNQPIEN